jgi:thioredoxin-related protein
MKNTGAQIALSALLLITTSFIQAQSGKLPPFKMMQTSGNIFKAQNLPMGKPILIVYFAPGCDHCEKMLKDFFKQAANFQKASVAFITYLPAEKVAKFEKDYNLEKYPNMYSGTEGSTFFVRNYYKISETPFVALYTKNGDFVTSYEREVDLKVLAEKIKGLN